MIAKPPGVKFDWSIRFDNILVLAVMVVGVASFIYEGRTDDAVMKSRFEGLMATVVRLEAQLGALTTQVTALSTQLAVLASQPRPAPK